MIPTPAAVVCPGCALPLKPNPALAGKQARCPKCGGPVRFPPSEAATRVHPRPAGMDFLGPPESADEIGRLGGFRVLRVLGVGGMGLVFAAEDPDLCRPV